MKRLKIIAKKIGFVHRGVYHVGSTMCGEANKIIEIADKAYHATNHIFLKEFNSEMPGLETISFTKNNGGEWVRLWRPVSLMYGGELAVNDAIPDISLETNKVISLNLSLIISCIDNSITTINRSMRLYGIASIKTFER